MSDTDNPPHVCPECSRSFAWGADDDSAIVDAKGKRWLSCRENAHWKLTFHFEEDHPDKGFACPEGSSQRLQPGSRDYWRKQPNGDRACSACGSLHPDDWMRLTRLAADPASEVRIERSDKGYKWYVTQPGVKNAMEGGIKFYTWHIPSGDWEAEINAILPGAVRASRVKFEAALQRMREDMAARRNGVQ